MCKIVSPNRTPGHLLYQSIQYFYQAQVSLGPVYGPVYGLWFETVLMWLWLMISTQYKLMVPIGQFGGDLEMPKMWARKSSGSARWCRSCREYWSCDHVGDNVCCWDIGR